MKRILFIEGIYPVNTRSSRIINTLKNDYNIKVVSWDRSNIYDKSKNSLYIFSSNEGYGNKIKKLLGIYKYFKYVKFVYTKEQPDILFVSQWDMLLLGFFLKDKKESVLIYDNIDMPSSNNKIINKLLLLLERVLLRKTDVMVFASRFFKKNYNFFNKKTILLENLPLRENYKLISSNRGDQKTKLAFVGTIRYYEILEKIVDVISSLYQFELHFYGNGPDEKKLEKYIQKKEYTNIYFYGRYNYENISEIYNSIDLIWAVYPNKDFNVKYAISNKFFESLLYEKPCFFSEKTDLGGLVEKNKIGFTIDPYNPSKFFEDFNIKEFLIKVEEYKRNMKKYKEGKILFWEDNEDNFLEELKE